MRNASRPSLHKSCQSGEGQVKNHRANLKDNKFLHQKKDQLNVNQVCGKVESKPRLNLPKAGDQRAWKELDNELSEALESLPIYKDPTVELERRESFIYNFMKEKYGTKQPPKPKDEKKYSSLVNRKDSEK